MNDKFVQSFPIMSTAEVENEVSLNSDDYK